MSVIKRKKKKAEHKQNEKTQLENKNYTPKQAKRFIFLYTYYSRICVWPYNHNKLFFSLSLVLMHLDRSWVGRKCWLEGQGEI